MRDLPDRLLRVRTHAVFLRGVNVGGRNLIRMAELRASIAEGGFEDVESYLQSGNLVLGAPGMDAATLEGRIQSIITRRFDLHIDAFAIDSTALREIIDSNPFPEAAAQRSKHLVAVLLHEAPDFESVEAELTRYAGPERIAAGQRCLYIDYAAGIGESKLSKVAGLSRLTSRGTARNWNTLMSVYTMLIAPSN